MPNATAPSHEEHQRSRLSWFAYLCAGLLILLLLVLAYFAAFAPATAYVGYLLDTNWFSPVVRHLSATASVHHLAFAILIAFLLLRRTHAFLFGTLLVLIAAEVLQLAFVDWRLETNSFQMITSVSLLVPATVLAYAAFRKAKN